MRITAVSPLICVSDLERSNAFYRLLGFEAAVRWGTYTKMVAGEGGSVLHLALPGDPPPDRPTITVGVPAVSSTVSALLVVEVDDCAAAARTLARAGVSLLGGPGTPPWGGEVRAFVRDPDGHVVELNEPLR